MSIGLILFIYSILVYAVSVMLVYFNGPFGIIDKFREWVSSKSQTLEELFSCMFCLPTNVGIIMSLISMFSSHVTAFTPFTILFLGHWNLWPLIALFDGLYAGGVVYLIHTFQQHIELNTRKF